MALGGTEMTPRTCIYKCGTLLDGWDDEARKYKEAGTGGLHTKERCQEAKTKLEAKNDHGNELVQQKPIGPVTVVTEYVDHTLKPDFNLKTLTDPTPEGIDLKYNNFAKEHKIRYSQSHVLGSQYTVYVWYEETK